MTLQWILYIPFSDLQSVDVFVESRHKAFPGHDKIIKYRGCFCEADKSSESPAFLEMFLFKHQNRPGKQKKARKLLMFLTSIPYHFQADETRNKHGDNAVLFLFFSMFACPPRILSLFTDFWVLCRLFRIRWFLVFDPGHSEEGCVIITYVFLFLFRYFFLQRTNLKHQTWFSCALQYVW